MYSNQYGYSDSWKPVKARHADCNINRVQRVAGRERLDGKKVKNGPLYINDGKCVRLA